MSDLSIPRYQRVKTIPPYTEIVLTAPSIGSAMPFRVTLFIGGKPNRVTFWKREAEAMAAFEAFKRAYGATEGDD